MEGWVKLHRKTLENPVVCKDPDHFFIWCLLLLSATHKDKPAFFGGKKITLLPGQLITGRKSLSAKTGISESKIKRILILFESDQQIDRKRSNQNSLITILNWENYQQNDQQNGQPVTSQWTASDQPVTTNKNDKNDKNEIKEKDMPEKVEIDDFFESVWKLYPVKKGKASVSPSQKKKLYALGYDTIKTCIDRYTNSKEDWRAFKDGSTFFNSGYVDYLDENYQETKTVNSDIHKAKRVEIEW